MKKVRNFKQRRVLAAAAVACAALLSCACPGEVYVEAEDYLGLAWADLGFPTSGTTQGCDLVVDPSDSKPDCVLHRRAERTAGLPS